MNLNEVKGIIEGLLFIVGDEGLTIKQVTEVLEINEQTAKEIIEEITDDYLQVNRGIAIVEVAGSFQLTTKQDHAPYFKKLVESPSVSSLSQAALETLAIVAYKQPITRTEIEEIRGVKTERPLQTLMAKSLIKEAGRADGPGRAILYSTSKEFLGYFGLRSLEELPSLPEGFEQDSIEDEADLFFEKFQQTLES